MSHQPLTRKQRASLYRTLVLMLAGVSKADRMARHESVEANSRACKTRCQARRNAARRDAKRVS